MRQDLGKRSSWDEGKLSFLPVTIQGMVNGGLPFRHKGDFHYPAARPVQSGSLSPLVSSSFQWTMKEGRFGV